MKRNKDQNYERRYGDDFHGLKVGWTQNIVSSEGAHYHCWIPRGLSLTHQVELRLAFKRKSKNIGDPVSWSWDYIPKYKIEEYHYGYVVVKRDTGEAVSKAHVEYLDAMVYMNELEK